jgi:hypothetical protein
MKIPGIIVGAGGAALLFFALKNRNGSTTIVATAVPAPVPALAPAPGPAPEPTAVIVRPGGQTIPPVTLPPPAPPIVIAPPPAARSIAKLGNADPKFQSWLAGEVTTLMGPVSGSGGFKAADRAFLTGAITNRRIPDYFKSHPGDCGAPPQLGSLGIVNEAGSVTSLGLQGVQLGAQIAGTAISAIPVAGAAVAVFTAAYNLAFGHHAQAVKVEQNTLCNAIPLANQYMDAIDAAYRQGQLGSLQAQATLEGLYQKFLQLVAGIIKPTPFSPMTAEQEHVCNAACVYARCLRGIIDARVMFDY